MTRSSYVTVSFRRPPSIFFSLQVPPPLAAVYTPIHVCYRHGPLECKWEANDGPIKRDIGPF